MAKRKKFSLHNILVEKYAAEGKCVARHEDKVIFIEGAVPGDLVDIYVSRNKKDWAEGTVTQIVTPSMNRVASFCQHFGTCGGCKWQMLPYNLQLEYKEQQVKDQLQRIGKVDVDNYLPIQGASQEKLYRNKIEFTFSTKKYLTREDLASDMSNDMNVLGFHAPRLFDKVIDINTCYLQQEPTNAIKNFVRDYSYRHSLTFHDFKNHTGFLRNLIIRISSLEEVMVNLVFGENNEAAIESMMSAIQQEFPSITSLQYTINTKMNDTIYDLEVNCYAGKNTIEEKLENFRFKISPKSFFQTNTKQAEALYGVVRNFADCKGGEILYDLYCGTGSIGIFLSPNVKKIIGVEVIPDAIADAKLNAELNGIDNAHFFVGDVIKICNDDFFSVHGKPDVLIIDPPRAGCHPDLLEKLLQIEAAKLVYVSCNPATQARDLQVLQAKYHITLSQAVDMFPQTHHIENVVQLKLK